MPHSNLPFRLRPTKPPLAVILGLNEIATAVAVALHRVGFGVLMSHDPDPPVIRRGMSFFDALYHDRVVIEGAEASCVEDTLAASAIRDSRRIAVTRLGLMELLTIGGIDVLIDGRMQKHRVTPDLRHVAPVTVGLGPGFTVGENCDVAVETKPGQEGRTLTRGSTIAADGVARLLGGLGKERFIYSVSSDLWHSALDVGTRVYKGMPLGMLGSQAILAPFDGLLRGIARDGVWIPQGVKLVELDPRGREAQWTGIDEKGYAVAEAACRAIQVLVRARRSDPTEA